MGVVRDLHRRCIYLISDFLPFSQSRLSNQFLTCEDGGELNLVYDLGMGVARDSHRRCIYYPEHVYTWEGYSSHSVSSCVCVCVCVSPLNS